MSRTLERKNGPAGTNVFLNLFTVPAGHKYELVRLTAGEATTQAGVFYLLQTFGGGGALFLDEFAYAAGKLAVTIPCHGAVFYAGDSLSTGAVAAGGTVWVANITYVDVHYV